MAVDLLRDGGTLRLALGEYQLTALPYADSTCANCQRPDTLIQATRALRVSGQGIRIVGVGAGKTVIATGAGYGFLFENCVDCSLDSLTLTGVCATPAAWRATPRSW